MIIQTDLNGTLSAWMTKDVFCKYFSFFMFWFISVCCSWVRQSPNCFSVFLPLWWAAVAKRIIPSINKDTRHPVGQTKGWRESPDQPDLGWSWPNQLKASLILMCTYLYLYVLIHNLTCAYTYMYYAKWKHYDIIKRYRSRRAATDGRGPAGDSEL